MIPASWMPLTNPRQALARSKFRQLVGRPSWWCTATAVDGSRCSRETDVLIITPTCSGWMPASASALAPAIAAPSAKLTSSGHQRRSRTPASLTSMPGSRPTRS